MKHIITYAPDVNALAARLEEIIDDWPEITRDEETGKIRFKVSSIIGAEYNEIKGVWCSGALIVLPGAFDEEGNVQGVLKELSGVLEILAVGDTRSPETCPYEKIFADPKLLVKYLNFCPRGFVKDLDGNDTDELKPLVGFGRYDL